jgi:hypothetical protein
MGSIFVDAIFIEFLHLNAVGLLLRPHCTMSSLYRKKNSPSCDPFNSLTPTARGTTNPPVCGRTIPARLLMRAPHRARLEAQELSRARGPNRWRRLTCEASSNLRDQTDRPNEPTGGVNINQGRESKRLLAALLGFLLGTIVGVSSISVSAQTAKEADEKKPSTRRERLLQIVKDQNKDWQERSDAANAMKPSPEGDKAMEELKTQGVPFVQKALALAREDDKDEIAFSAAFYAFYTEDTKVKADAADFIANHLANYMKVIPSIPEMAHLKGGPESLSRLVENTGSREIGGAVRFALLDAEIARIDRPFAGKALPAAETISRYAVVEDKLKRLSVEFAGVKVSTRLGDSISQAAEKEIFFVENLTVGKKAPDFECELLDGKRAKLSDFRGNVVVLDVWATLVQPLPGDDSPRTEARRKAEGQSV